MITPRFSPAAGAFASVALIWAMSAGAPGQPTPTAQALAAGPFAATNTPTRTPTPINIGNFVWDDRDGDGVQDAGEPGLPGVQVQLWNGAKTQLFGTTTTNASGFYTLVAPTPGSYRVRVLLAQANDHFSPKDASGADTTDSDINPTGADFGFTDSFTLASNVISTTIIDAGIVVFRPPTPTRTPTPINVGNFVWNDTNANGVQDAGEPGLNGVQVQLWNGAKTQLFGTTTTNASGFYTLVAPTPGSYRVRVLLPSGAGFAPKDASADTTDSDINPDGADFGFTDVYTFASNLISITTIDAGLIRVPATPTLTRTPSATPTSTATATSTATPTATAIPTVVAGMQPRVFVPQARR